MDTTSFDIDRIAVSSWSLHRLLGHTYAHKPGGEAEPAGEPRFGEGVMDLLALPAAIKARGISRLEICHFHLPTRSRTYLAELRAALVEAGVELQTLLIDDGDISDPDTSERDLDWLEGWLGIADALGAKHARVIAGRQKPTREAIDRSVSAFRELLARTEGLSPRLVTENWFDLLARASDVHDLLDRLEGHVGLNADFGNWSGPGKYAELRSIFARAELCHAKADFNHAGRLDEKDYGECLDAAESVGYKGPYTLIFDSPLPEEWHGIEIERQFILTRLRAGSDAGR